MELVAGPEGMVAVRMTRTCDPNDGGASGLIQKISNVYVKAGSNMELKALVKCDMQNDGVIARTDTKWYPEGAVQFRICYTLEDGKKGEWFHGFYYGSVPTPIASVSPIYPRVSGMLASREISLKRYSPLKVGGVLYLMNSGSTVSDGISMVPPLYYLFCLNRSNKQEVTEWEKDTRHETQGK